MTRYDLGVSEETLNRTQPMPPPLPPDRTQVWTPGGATPRTVYRGGTRPDPRLRWSLAGGAAVVVLCGFLLLSGILNPLLLSTPSASRKTAGISSQSVSRLLTANAVLTAHSSGLPSAFVPPPTSLPPAWKPSAKTRIAPSPPME